MKTPTYEQTKLRLDNLRELVRELYGQEPCGGPLHIITDDGNVRDGDIVFCYRYLHEEGDDVSFYIQSLSKAILHELALMSRAQRVIWWLRDAIEKEGVDPVELCARAYAAGVEEGSNGCYDSRLVLYDRINNENVTTVLWEGLEQTRAKRLQRTRESNDG